MKAWEPNQFDMTFIERVRKLIPAFEWLRTYPRGWFMDDFIAGLVTAVLLIPQGMAYAILAGLPPEVGLYASILPPIVYALLGTSRALSVGPVSVAALLVASSLSEAGQAPGSSGYLADALLLAAMIGLILLLMSVLRLGALANFLSHPVLSGFTSGAALLIILSQIPNMTGMSVPQTGSGVEAMTHVATDPSGFHATTVMLGIAGIAMLLLFRSPFIRVLKGMGLSESTATLISRAGPLAMIALLTTVVATMGSIKESVEVVGTIPSGLPALTLHFWRTERVLELLPSALMISLIAYVESISVARVLAHRRRERISNNQELVALGASNLAAAVTGGMPVAGGFSRSMVNFSAGARTQLAAIITAVMVGLAAAFFTPLFYYLPKAALAAVIVVAVAPLIDWRAAVQAYHYDKADGAALATTFVGVLVFDIEVGLMLGVAVAIGVFLWRSSRPHIAVVGRVPGTEHFRNVDRHRVETWPHLLLLRVDRSLFFANVNYVDDMVARAASEKQDLTHLVIICSAVNSIDHSALESLEQLASSLGEAGIQMHLAEVKGPVMDRLKQTDFLDHLNPGRVFLSVESAVQTLRSDSLKETEHD